MMEDKRNKPNNPPHTFPTTQPHPHEQRPRRFLDIIGQKSLCLQVRAVTYCDHSGFSLLTWTIFHILFLWNDWSLKSWTSTAYFSTFKRFIRNKWRAPQFIAKWIVPLRWQPIWWEATWTQWRVLNRSELALAVGNQPVRWAQKVSQYVFVSIISSILFFFGLLSSGQSSWYNLL